MPHLNICAQCMDQCILHVVAILSLVTWYSFSHALTIFHFWWQIVTKKNEVKDPHPLPFPSPPPLTLFQLLFNNSVTLFLLYSIPFIFCFCSLIGLNWPAVCRVRLKNNIHWYRVYRCWFITLQLLQSFYFSLGAVILLSSLQGWSQVM